MAPDAWYEPGGGRPPWREPEALLEYIRSSPGVDLGVNNRVWLAEKSSTLIRRSSAPAERALYREAVLLAAEKGRQAEPSVRFTFWLYWATVTRVAYMRSAGKGQEWDALEAESVYDDYLAAVRVDAAWMSVALSGSRELPFAVGPHLADEMARTVRAITSLAPLLPPAKRHVLEQWLALGEQIRHLGPH